MNKARLTGAVLAVAAAAAFTLAPVAAFAKHQHMVKCYGVNACKGHSSCKTAKSACKGHNSCKGKGWKKMSKKACMKAGGKIKHGKAMHHHNSKHHHAATHTTTTDNHTTDNKTAN